MLVNLLNFSLFVSFVLLFGRQSSTSAILTTGRVSPRLWLYWVCTIWAMKYDNKVKVKVKVKSGFSLFFSISLFQKRQATKRSARRQWICVKKLLKIPKATEGTWVAKFYGSCYNPTHCQLKEFHSRSQSFDPFAAADQKDRSSGNENEGREKKRFHARG